LARGSKSSSPFRLYLIIYGVSNPINKLNFKSMKKVIGILGIATFVLAMSLNTYFTNEETEKENIDLMSLVSIATADA